jgi:Raf kinase inhibitor-like YbhB/YbcL family protein
MQTQATLTVRSSTYRDGETIPQSAVFDSFGCTGGNQSPDLAWSGGPPGTASYAITIWDPDAPTTVGWVHWIVFDIPAGATSLPARASAEGDLGIAGAKQGFTDFGFSRYGGPCPPPGPAHHYILTVCALDVPSLGVDETTTYAKLRFLMRGHVLAAGEITGLYASPAG